MFVCMYVCMHSIQIFFYRYNYENCYLLCFHNTMLLSEPLDNNCLNDWYLNKRNKMQMKTNTIIFNN